MFRRTPAPRSFARRGAPLTVHWAVDDGRETVTKTFYPRFTHVDREADYERAYAVFKERYGL